MSTITKEFAQDIIKGHGYGVAPSAVEALARIALAVIDSEPVVFTDERNLHHIAMGRETSLIWGKQNSEAGDVPLYRHAQQLLVPDDVLDALHKVARIRLDLNDFDGDRRGIADCLGDAEEALIEVVNRRAAMLQSGNSPAQNPGWIPVSERLPEVGGRYWCYVEEQTDLGKSHYQWNCSWNGERWWVEGEDGGIVTHWMPLPAAPLKVK